MENERLFSIGVLAQAVSSEIERPVTPQMINNYEKHGLIHHASKSKGGFRQYTTSDIHKVICIKQLQSQGFSLTQIKSKLSECIKNVNTDKELFDLPEDRRAQIIKASAGVFLRKGYAATTFREIAEEANISSSLIYQYFENKEELFLSFTENMSFGVDLARADALLDDQEKTSYEDVRRVLINLAIRFSKSHKKTVDLVRMVMCESRQFPEIGQEYLRKVVAPMETHLEHYFENLIEKGVIRKINPKHAVKIYIGIWSVTSTAKDFYGGENILYIPQEDEFGELVDIFLSGLYVSP